MKIAVYTIALNEEKFVERWYESAKDADYLLIADTGSTDKTIRLAKKLGINVIKISISPWRFDDARNVALASLPDDIDMCIAMDMDEVLSPGWREALEKTKGTQILYRFVYSWKNKEQTIPALITSHSKVHARHGYRWKYIVHEYIFPDRNTNHVIEESKDFEIRHYPDEDRAVSRYDSLIKDALEENPDSVRYQLYYAKSLFSTNTELAKNEFKKYISMKDKTKLSTDICSSYIALSILEPKKTKKHLMSAIKIWNAREPLLYLTMYYFNKGKWKKSAKYSKKILQITQRTTDHNYVEQAWGYLPKNMLYVSTYNSKFKNRKNKLSLNINGMASSNFDLFGNN